VRVKRYDIATKHSTVCATYSAGEILICFVSHSSDHNNAVSFVWGLYHQSVQPYIIRIFIYGEITVLKWRRWFAVWATWGSSLAFLCRIEIKSEHNAISFKGYIAAVVLFLYVAIATIVYLLIHDPTFHEVRQLSHAHHMTSLSHAHHMISLSHAHSMTFPSHRITHFITDLRVALIRSSRSEWVHTRLTNPIYMFLCLHNHSNVHMIIVIILYCYTVQVQWNLSNLTPL
jgi:hypothetical protein